MTNIYKSFFETSSKNDRKFMEEKLTDSSEWREWEFDSGIDEVLSDSPIDRFSVTMANEPTSDRTYVLRRGSNAPTLETATPPLLSNGKNPNQLMAQSMAFKATNLNDLREALSQYDGCALKNTAVNLVFGDGNPKADIMFVGEAPGADEDREGKPFVGISGRLLDKMITSINIKRESCYISNILPWRPPGNRPPTPAEIASCLPFIVRQIELVEPKILVLVGGIASKTLLARNEGIMRLRGRWFRYETTNSKISIPALAIFHPAFLLRSSNRKAEAWQDLLMLKTKLNQ